MSVIVLGATGYIGLAVAKALRVEGWYVYAQTRSEAKADMLLAEDLDPLVCDPRNATDVLQPLIDTAGVDAIVDCTADYEQPMAIPEAMIGMLENSAAQCQGHRRLYLCTGGILTMGDRSRSSTESDTCTGTHLPILEQRIGRDAAILARNSAQVATCLIRPSMVYGGHGGNTAHSWFKPLADKINGEGKLQIVGDSTRRWSWVHTADTGRAYTAVVNAPRSNVAGEAFNLGSSDGPTHLSLQLNLARLQGWEGADTDTVSVEPEGFALLENICCVVNDRKLRDATGYMPRHTSPFDSFPLMYRCYQAKNSK